MHMANYYKIIFNGEKPETTQMPMNRRPIK